MVFSREEFRNNLRKRFAEITEKNPHYSLRAFAKKTGLSASILSRVLSGKRNLSLETMLRISQMLDLNGVDLEPSDTKKVDILGLETFKIIADWYHFPLIELIQTIDFKSDELWIAKRLGLPLALVQAALDRMERLDLIERTEGKITTLKNTILKTTDDESSAAIRKHHTQMLEKAISALDDSIDLREFRGLNLRFDTEDLPEAKKMIRDFYKRFRRRFSKTKGKEIFQLNTQFFKLTREIK